MIYSASIFDDIKTEDDRQKLIKELSNEIGTSNQSIEKIGTEREIRVLNAEIKNHKLENKKNNNKKFSFILNESTIKSEFYYSCKIKKIPCYLQCRCPCIGIVDAIVKIKNRYYIIEFKKLRRNETILNHVNQLLRYKKSGMPIIFVENNFYNDLIIQCIKNQNLDNEIYYFENAMNLLIQISC